MKNTTSIHSRPEWGLYNALLNGIVYFVGVPIVGVNSLLNLTVVILDVIASSVSSINLVNAECLNALSKFVRLSVLKFVTVVRTFDSRVSFALIVFLEL